MAAVSNALIVGGGIAGMCAAIQLRKLGVRVDLIEIDPDWRSSGAGITLQGITLRAFTEIGVVDAIMNEGWCADGLDVLTAAGHKVAEMPTPRVGRPDVPGAGGILRPVLARILREATVDSGTHVRCGLTVQTMEQDSQHVHVTLSDGRREAYDLVVGADGLRSAMRERMFPDSPKPHYTGQGSWRAVVPRPPEIHRAAMCMGAQIKAGVNPVSKDEMYLFLTEPRPTPEHIADSELAGTLRGLLAEFSGPFGQIRDGLSQDSRIVYRPFWALLLEAPWHSGRTVLIGDAVHATTPHLASGAGIGIEDAIVLAEELDRTQNVDSALSAFTNRRFERCKMVVNNSLRLGEIERSGGSKEEHSQLMRHSAQMLLAKY
jgi:2-polyprenyl-6-methoxyphenol hydroxylase-like FAD-dependent oxidoreductase